jgi:uncharacterized protein (DUF4415 family)
MSAGFWKWTASTRKRANSAGTLSGVLAALRSTPWFTFIGGRKMAKKSSASSQRETLVTVRSEDIFKKPFTKRERESMRRTAGRQAAGDDSQIDFSDIPELTDEQLAAAVRFRDVPKKELVSLRLRADVIEWLKARAKGPGHLTLVNDILLNIMDAERRAKKSA